MYDKKENAVISKANSVPIHCDDCHGTDIADLEECFSCYGFGFYSICGTRDNPFPRKDD